MKSPQRAIYTIAREIKEKWGDKMNYAAIPYVNAMLLLEHMGDKYMHDDAQDVVLRFLVNAGTWRGPDARRIKEEPM